MAKKNDTVLKSLEDLPEPTDDQASSSITAEEVVETPTPRRRISSMFSEPPSEEEKLEGIDLVKINEIISSSDMQKGGFIRIERKGPFDDKFSYLCRIAAETFDIDSIKKLYGGGDYNCRTFRASGQMYKPFSFSIDARFRGQLGESDIKALNQEPNGNGLNTKLLEAALNRTEPSNKNDNMLIMRMMEQSSEKSSQMMTLMVTMMMESTKSMATMMTACMSAVAGKPQQPTGLDPVLVELLKDKVSGDPMERMLKMMGMAKELAAPSNSTPEREPAMWEKLVQAFAPSVVPALLGGGKAGPIPQATQVVDNGAVQQQQIPSPQPAVQQTQPDNQQESSAVIRIFLNRMLNAASQDADPLLYVDMILEMTNEQQLGEIKRNLTDASWPVNVFGADQRAVQFRPWLEKLKAELLAVKDESDVTNSGGPASGS